MKILLLIIALFLSGFFSGSEIVFVSISRIQTEIWLRKKLKGAASAFYLSSQPERFLSTVLVGTNIVNITFASLATYYLQAYLNDFLIVLFNSAILLVLGESIPKTICRKMAHRWARGLALPLRFFHLLFFPVIRSINLAVSCILKLLGQTQPIPTSSFFSRRDIEILLHEGERVGIVGKDEWKIISRLFLLSKRQAREIMVPRTEIVFVQITDSIDQIKKTFQQCSYSRLPVIKEDLDHICGIVHSADLLKKPDHLQQILRKPTFVPESKRCFDLLRQMKKEKISLVILIDEYGGTSGLVTLEDIIEELFGDIQDEYDKEHQLFHLLRDGSIITDGRAEVMQINEKLKCNLPLGNYETINGLILQTMGRIPKTGEEIQIGNYRIKIIRASANRVEIVNLRYHPFK